MDILNLIISLISGIIGGNIAGAAMPNKTLGGLGNSIAGFFGGGIGGVILQALGLFNQAGAANISLESILANIGTGGVGGAILMIIVAFIKNAMNKKA
jgi:uncharacterized membrane protein YeaQ/YmgE (transglycosylase-associated protein family)